MKINNNNDFTIKDVGKEVLLHGWVMKKRDLGGVIFIDLRDRSGIIQLIVNPDNKYYDIASNLKSEYVIEVNGIIRERTNKKLPLYLCDFACVFGIVIFISYIICSRGEHINPQYSSCEH